MSVPEYNYRNILSVCILLLISGCGVTQRTSQPVWDNSGNSSAPITASVSNYSEVTRQLFGAHSEWKGTPYRLGGNGINGVDCSSFTQIVFQNFFGIDLPRNTRQQLQEGSGVRRNFVRPGDLIFFRTSRGMLHVGILMEDGDFLHASTSSGVMISNVSERYWASKYLGARRIL
jgi:cell wall-associated NlpC family hydrolase